MCKYISYISLHELQNLICHFIFLLTLIIEINDDVYDTNGDVFLEWRQLQRNGVCKQIDASVKWNSEMADKTFISLS